MNLRASFTENPQIEILEEFYSPERIIEAITPLLQERRLEKIERVINSRTYQHTLCLENIYDQGNVNAVIRSAENLGIGSLDMINSKRTKYQSRTTQGAHKWVNLNKYEIEQSRECFQSLKNRGFQLVATALSETAVSLYEVDLEKPTCFIVGNEKDGVSPLALEYADKNCLIPTSGFSQSFNISVASAILLSHMQYMRYQLGPEKFSLNEDEKLVLRAHFLARTYKNHRKLKEELL